MVYGRVNTCTFRLLDSSTYWLFSELGVTCCELIVEALQSSQSLMDGLHRQQDAAGMTARDSLDTDAEEQQMNEDLIKVAASAWQKGKPRDSRDSRARLLKQHRKRPAASQPWSLIITNQYLPSSRSFSNLESILLEDLRVESVYEDNYIVLRCVQIFFCDLI